MIKHNFDKRQTIQLGGESMGLVNQLRGLCRRALIDEDHQAFRRALRLQVLALRRYRRRKQLLAR